VFFFFSRIYRCLGNRKYLNKLRLLLLHLTKMCFSSSFLPSTKTHNQEEDIAAREAASPLNPDPSTQSAGERESKEKSDTAQKEIAVAEKR